MTLEDVLRAPLPGRVDDVVARLQAIEEALPKGDGVRAFTALYRAVTEAVDERVRPGTFADPRFTRWLDVVFANLYLRALRAHVLGPKQPPRAWAALFEARSRLGVAPVQFALAGMNAHVNRDLPLALVETCRALDVVPVRGCPQHADFRAIDPLLAETEARVRADFATGVVGWADEALGELDSVVAMWNVRRARSAAWVNAETLWAIRDVPFAGARFVVTLDRLVGLASRGLLRRVV
ncbi:MAG TPA: DUF5995 family protein [Gaiellaceae bacterium]|nr:DUF5995 family protein [Gaiellaceae bacterium]